MKQKYYIDKTWEGQYGEEIHFDGVILIEDEVIKAVDDEWRKIFYDLKTPQEIAEHIAYNQIVNDAGLSRLDGFANFPDSYSVIGD
jgi:hypothetical protein